MQIITPIAPRNKPQFQVDTIKVVEVEQLRPIVVYYVHMEDERHIIHNWKIRRDYACCVMAKTINHAIEKTENIALSQPGAKFIKVLGVVPGKMEWVNEKEPLTQNPHINTKNPL